MKEIIYNLWPYYDSAKPLNILLAGQSFCDKSYCIERHNEDIMSFEYIIEGSGTLEINGQTLYPQKNDIYLLTKNSHHRYFSSADKPWNKIWIVFNGPFAEALFSLYLPANTYLFSNLNILPLMKEAVQAAAHPDRGVADLEAEIIFKIVLAIKNYLSNPTIPLPEQMKHWLDQNIESLSGLEQLCRQFNYSKNHLITVFRNAYGVTPGKYLSTQKIIIAGQYLRNTNLSVNEIASRLSFADSHYFSNCFKIEMGITPVQYRKEGMLSIKTR